VASAARRLFADGRSTDSLVTIESNASVAGSVGHVKAVIEEQEAMITTGTFHSTPVRRRQIASRYDLIRSAQAIYRPLYTHNIKCLINRQEMATMDRHTECADCRTRYNAIDNDDCPYCDFPNFPNTTAAGRSQVS